MKKYFGSLAAVCLLFAGLGFAAPSAATAQDHANGATMPPNVLVIMREYLKPGKSGSVHEKSESAFVQAFGQAKEQTHYLAMNALSGKSRALFFLGYDNFAEWGQDNEAMMKNSALAGAVDSAMQSDGELLSSYDSGVFTLNKDLSLRPMTVVGRIHYFEVDAFVVRPGKDRQFEELSKMYRDAYQKIPNVKWVAYEGRYGFERQSVSFHYADDFNSRDRPGTDRGQAIYNRHGNGPDEEDGRYGDRDGSLA
jgi:hypothetical protein